MIVVCNFFDKEIPMPLAKECEGMEVLISNYKDTSDMSVLRPFGAGVFFRKINIDSCFFYYVFL